MSVIKEKKWVWITWAIDVTVKTDSIPIRFNKGERTQVKILKARVYAGKSNVDIQFHSGSVAEKISYSYFTFHEKENDIASDEVLS